MTRRSRGLLVFSVAIATAGFASAAVHRTMQQPDTPADPAVGADPAVPVQPLSSRPS